MTRLAAEVLVVGGGPAGAATAARLARAGRDVLLLEKTSFPREKPCAEFLSPGVVDALGRLGALPTVRSAEAAWPLGMRLCTPRREYLLTYDAPDGERRTALGIARAVLDAILLDHARAQGVRVRERTVARSVLVEAGRVVGVQAQGQRGLEEPRARLVVAADGIHSTLARALGLDLPARWPRRLGLVARYAGVDGLDRYGEMHVGDGCYCGIGPVGGGLVSLGLAAAWADRPAGESVAAQFERRIANLPGVARRLAGARRVTPVRGVGPIARRVARVAGPGYLLVGDAAGFLDPFTGEGVYRALRGAEVAAAVADDALRRDDPAGDLTAEYTRARRAAFADKERMTVLIQRALDSRRIFDYALARLAARPRLAARLAAAIGDYQPAGPLLTPGFVWSLLHP